MAIYTSPDMFFRSFYDDDHTNGIEHIKHLEKQALFFFMFSKN